MAGTPINVFGRSDDVEAVVRRVTDRLPGAKVERDAGEIQIVVGRGRRLIRRSGDETVVDIGLGHLAGEPGQSQRLGMANFLAGSMSGPGLEHVLSMVPHLRLTVALTSKQQLESEDGDPELLVLAKEIAGVADGFVLDLGQGAIWDDRGGLLASAGPPSASSGPEPSDDDDDVEPDPPAKIRVLSRLVVLAALAIRGLAEAEDDEVDQACGATLAWVEALGARAELEPAEREVLDAPPRSLPPQARIDAVWRFEGAAVLAWSLGLLELPPHDQLVVPVELGDALGFPDADRTRALVAAAELRTHRELETQAERQFAIHWRLREFSLRAQPKDFAEVARTVWFGPLDIGGCRLVDGDLAVGERPIAEADPDHLEIASSAATERHIAANWLVQGGVYSETDDST